MKNLHTFRSALLLIPFSLPLIGNSQNVAINATGNQADPSAMLDVSSQTAGVLIPRMSTSARNAISSPAVGLQIFNTDCNELNYWTGTCWISTGSLPTPGPLTSNSATILCALSTATYSIPAITGATQYIWSVPAGASINSGQGTTSISVTWGNISGEVCVNANDACESSLQRCIDVSINPIPPTPGNITGLASVSPGQSNVSYFIASVSGASSYTWTVPVGATIVTGTGTPVITVNFPCNAVAGNVTVTAGSNCGTSTASGQAITVTSYLSANAGSAVFGGAGIGSSPTATGGVSPYTYLWLPNSNLSSNTVANPTALCSGSTTTYTLNVTDANGCTATSSTVVTRNLTASAGSAVFGGAALSGSATGGASPYNYSWSPNSNLSSSTVATPTALCSGSTTTYTLTATDANGCTATSSVVVTRNLTANAGSAILGGVALNGSAAGGVSPYAYSWSPNSNLSGYTVSNPTALCSGSTTTYSVIVTDANGCTSTSSGVVVTRNLTASAGSNASTCTSATIGGSPTASGGNSGSYSYSWNPATNLSNSAVANPTATASNTTYTVTVMDANGCTATSSMSVSISSGTHGSQTFNYTGSQQTFTVPSCITSVTIQAYGAQGGEGYNAGDLANAGMGGYVFGTLTVTNGSTLYVNVGQQGANASNSASCCAGGWNGGGLGAYGSIFSGSYDGGGGGGATDVRVGGTALSNRVIVGGGGGGGSYYTNSTGGIGGLTGGNGTRSGSTDGSCGGGGTQSGGGAGATGSGNGGTGTSGTLGVGGNAGSGGCAGGGGGGYYGGGGGDSCNGGGGGGGSSYYGGMTSNTGNTDGYQTGNGLVIISY